MKNIKTIIITSIIFNFLLSQYGNIAINEVDDLDALYSNPAGLAIDHGEQTSLFMTWANGDDTSKPTYLYSGFKAQGFGYSLGYNVGEDSDGLFSPSFFKLGFGGEISSNFYSGFIWDKEGIVDVGFLYRPFNFLSTALKSSAKDDLSEINSIVAGIALRPLNNRFITLGFDQKYDSDINPIYGSLYFKIFPFNGIEIAANISSSEYCDDGLPVFTFDDLDNENQHINVNIGINLGKTKVYLTGDNKDNAGIGFSEGTHLLGSLFNKTEKGKEKYIKMSLDNKFIEEKPKISRFNFDFNPFAGGPMKPGTQIRTWMDNVDELTASDDIHGMIINLKNVSAGWGKRSDIRNTLKKFKDSGKKIIVYGEQGISNIDYSLVALADEIYINPLTGVDLRGLRMEVTFYRDLLDTLSIKPEIFRVNKEGKSYKTAGDSFINNTMSDEMRENYTELLDDFYSQFVNDIADGRNWTTEDTKNIINAGPYWIPQDAINAGLIDSTMYPDEFNEYIKSFNEGENNFVEFNEIDRSQEFVYDWKVTKKPTIAIIYAVGAIMSGKSQPGPQGSTIMGDETIREAIKTARENKNVDAIILRIDSGGGSALASDQMWREILNTTKLDSTNKKPFIASMSDVAASGGYYIACQADTIISYPMTVTGSIGVIGLGLDLSKLYKRIGINKEVIKRGEFSDLGTQSRQLSDEERKLIMDSIEESYRVFKQKVIDGRNNLNDINQLDDIALGRVWSGNKAQNNYLVDEIGGLRETLKLAKNMAGIDSEEDIHIIEYPNFGGNEFQDFFENAKTDDNLILSLIPEKMKEELKLLNIIPILEGNKVYFMLPYEFDIN